MMFRRWGRAWIAIVALVGTGCTALKEIPRSEYAAQPERKHVRVMTRDGLQYEFDYTQVQGDSLIGYRERDSGGPAVDIATVPFALEDITAMRVRGLDWYRTGLIGGGLIAALVATGLTTGGSDPPSSGNPGGGGRVP
jgi:hypothetical protein